MKRGQLKSFIFLILIGVLVIGFVSAFTPAPMPGFTPPTESKYKPPFSYVGLKDSDKWKGQGEYEEQPPDKDDAGKWDSYDREIISQLTAGELNQHKEEAANLFNKGKLSSEQMKQFVKDNSVNNGLKIDDVPIGSQIYDGTRGKQLQIIGQKSPVNLWDKGVKEVSIDSGVVEIVRGGRFSFDGSGLPGNTPAPQIVPASQAQIPPRLQQQPAPGQIPSYAGGPQQSSGGFGQNGVGPMQDLSQVLGLVGQMLGMIPKPEGQMDVKGNNELAFRGEGSGAYFRGVDVAQNCYSGFGENGACLNQNGNVRAYGENALIGDNLEVIVPDQAIAYLPEGMDTQVDLGGIPGDAEVTLANEGQLAGQYVNSAEDSLISAAVIGDLGAGQYVKFINHDLGLGGRRILVEILKSFDEIQGDGSELWVKNGDVYVKYEGVKIYYPRRISDSLHSISKISNSRNHANEFSLIEYKENKARMMDDEGKTTIGGWEVEHPRNPNLRIAKIREGMWVER